MLWAWRMLATLGGSRSQMRLWRFLDDGRMVRVVIPANCARKHCFPLAGRGVPKCLTCAVPTESSVSIPLFARPREALDADWDTFACDRVPGAGPVNGLAHTHALDYPVKRKGTNGSKHF